MRSDPDKYRDHPRYDAPMHQLVECILIAFDREFVIYIVEYNGSLAHNYI